MRRPACLAAWAALALLIGGAAAAEVYRWTDDQGQLHFTSSLDQVPARYRHQIGREPNDPDKGTVSIVPGSDQPVAPASPNRRLQQLRHRNRELGKPASKPARVHDLRMPAPAAPDPKPEHRYDTKCNSRGERCRRIQTDEFRQWKAREKLRDGAPAAHEE